MKCPYCKVKMVYHTCYGMNGYYKCPICLMEIEENDEDYEGE